MSFDKSYPNRKDHRKKYRGAKSVDRTCRCHGSCPYCESNRIHSTVKRREKADYDLKYVKDYGHKEENKKLPLKTGFESKEAAAKLGYIAAAIMRISDGQILTLNSDMETYSFSEVIVNNTQNYQYSYERLMEDHRAKGKFKVLSWIKNVDNEKYSKFTNKNTKISD